MHESNGEAISLLDLFKGITGEWSIPLHTMLFSINAMIVNDLLASDPYLFE